MTPKCPPKGGWEEAIHHFLPKSISVLLFSLNLMAWLPGTPGGMFVKPSGFISHVCAVKKARVVYKNTKQNKNLQDFWRTLVIHNQAFQPIENLARQREKAPLVFSDY